MSPELVWVHGDPTRLDQVTDDLLHNATKYTDEGGAVWIAMQFEDDVMVLRVRDTGVGIAAEMLPLIFDPHPGGAIPRWRPE